MSEIRRAKPPTIRVPGEFGFVIEWKDRSDYKTTTSGWRVFLPARGNWDIVGEDYDGEPDHAAAVERMERFVAEASAALDALRSGVRHPSG